MGALDRASPRLAVIVALGALAAALLAACSASEPPAEVADELEGVFTEASATPSELAMYRGGPTRTGVYNTRGVLQEPEAKWTFQANGRIATSAVISGDKIMFGADDGTFYALDVETGEQLWTLEVGRQIRSSPLVSDGIVYFGADDRILRAIEVETGHELWSFEANVDIRSSPAVAEGTIFFPSGRDLFYALDARTGLLNWEKNLNECCAAVFENSSPTIVDGLLLVASSKPGGNGATIVQAIDDTSRNTSWSTELTGIPFGAVAVSKGTAFIVGSSRRLDGRLHALDLESQSVLWTFETDDRAPVHTSPAVTGDLVIFSDSKGRLRALDVETGDVEWSFESRGDVATSPSVADGLVYFGILDGAIIAVDLITGQERWRFQTDLGSDRSSPCKLGSERSCFSHGPVIADGVLYVGNAGGTFYALQAGSSRGE